MSIFNRGPYTDIHRLDLDWLLAKVKEQEATIADLKARVEALEERLVIS